MKDVYGMIRFDYAKSNYFTASVSGYGYFGNNNLALPLPTGHIADVSQRQIGIQANLRFRMVDLYAAYSIDKITNIPTLPPEVFDNTATGLSVAMDVRATEQLLFSTRYDYLDAGGFQNTTVTALIPTAGLPIAVPYSIRRTSTSMVGVQLKYYLRPNIMFMIRDDINVLGSEDGSTPERNLRNFFTLGVDIVF